MVNYAKSRLLLNLKELNFEILIILSSLALLFIATYSIEPYISLNDKLINISVAAILVFFLIFVYQSKFLSRQAKYIYPIVCSIILTNVWFLEKGSIDNVFIYFSILVMSTFYFDYKALIVNTISISIINILAYILFQDYFYKDITLEQFLGMTISFIFVGTFLAFIIKRLISLLEETRTNESRARRAVKHLEKALHTLDKTYNELISTQTQLEQQEKMASLGMLVSGVAHEINNPLGAISSNTSLYKLMTDQLKNYNSADQNEKLNEIIKNLDMLTQTNVMACQRLTGLVKSLRIFARTDEAEYKDTNIHENIDSTLTLLTHKFKNKIEIIKEYGEIPIITCYTNKINQVLMNILANAGDAIAKSGKIWIKTYYENEKVYIKIKDNGLGIKPESLQKIFESGFTTKGAGAGTGLGLAIVFKIIEEHKGKISVESELGVGTEFTIELPRKVN